MQSFSFLYNRWGCTHEKDAVEAYTKQQKALHGDLKIEEAGLFISMERPYVGATPDGLVTCTCCGKGTVEVKCPFGCKQGLPDDDSNFCTTKDSSGII